MADCTLGSEQSSAQVDNKDTEENLTIYVPFISFQLTTSLNNDKSQMRLTYLISVFVGESSRQLPEGISRLLVVDIE